MNSYNRLVGQVAIVTGGSIGIGGAISDKLAREGATVIVADITEENAKNKEAELIQQGYKAEAYLIDVRNTEEIFKMTDYIAQKYTKIDILVNNAGVQKPCPSMMLSEEDFDWIMDVNIKAAFFCSQAAGRVMRKNGKGRIVNISSSNSRMMNVGRAPYCISKTGIVALTSVLGAEWGIYNIRVNAIAPGWIRTEMVQRGMDRKAISKEQLLSVIPNQRLGEPSEIADLACYLVSDEASLITGHTTYCDGGYTTGILPNALDYIRANDVID